MNTIGWIYFRHHVPKNNLNQGEDSIENKEGKDFDLPWVVDGDIDDLGKGEEEEDDGKDLGEGRRIGETVVIDGGLFGLLGLMVDVLFDRIH